MLIFPQWEITQSYVENNIFMIKLSDNDMFIDQVYIQGLKR